MLAGGYRLGPHMATCGEERRLDVGPLTILHDDRAEVARSGAVTCVAEGRLYDSDQLARELHVSPESASELLARAFERHGSGILQRLRGTFAFVAWDEAEGRGLLAADQMTTRPIFTADHGDSFAFGTELRSLLGVLPRCPPPDPASIAYWLVYRSTVAERTLYEGVTRLSPGCCRELSRTGWRQKSYWSPQPGPLLEGDRDELAGVLREGIEWAVSRRLNGSSAVLLSGGVDSSVVTTVAAGAVSSPSRLRTYSAVFPGQPCYDESERVEALTSALGVTARRFTIKPVGAVSVGLDYQRRWDVPLSSAGGMIETALMARAAGEGVTTMFDGQGGDELFGESRYLIADRLLQGRLSSAVRLARRLPCMGENPSRSDLAWALKLYGIKGIPPHRPTWLWRRARRADRFSPSWMTEHAATLYAGMFDPWAWKRWGAPRWWAHLRHSLVGAPQDEGRTDYFRRRGEAVGVLSESPLYDVDLVELALRFPPELAFDPMLNRTLIRDALTGRMPDAVRLQNRKANFSTFYYGAVSGREFSVINEVLGDPKAEVLDYLDGDRLSVLLSRRPEDWPSRSAWTALIWGFFAMECWLRSQGDDSYVERLLTRADVPELDCEPA